MTRLTADHVVELARSWFPEAADNPHTMLGVLRKRTPAFVPAWLSALDVTGVALRPEHHAELATARDRVTTMRALTEALVAKFPEAQPLKGVAVVDRYPAGVVRTMNDVDVVVPDIRTLWTLAEWLRDELGLTIVKALSAFGADDGGPVGLLLSLEAPPVHPLAQRVNVEITTHAWLGDAGAVRPRRTLPGDGFGLPEQLLMIVAERLEGPFGLKDVLDGAVLQRELSAAESERLVASAAELGVLPHLAELRRHITEHGLGPDLPTPRPRRTVLGRGVAQVARGPLVAALRHLQRAEAFPGPFAGQRRWMWRAVESVLPTAAPLRRRLWAYGVPVTGTAPEVLRTPFGSFLMVGSAAVGEHWLRVPGVDFEVAQ
ncbi:hypothetical protein ABZX92_12750 [Lentzea sp. NPDC006480]|uniref:hypothetical protein n=1 Tax=Lentzea sp. NPDC006480 TaxID=3157176 RepID=UPI0033B05DFF